MPEWNFGFTLGCEYKGFNFNVLFTGIANRSMFVGNNVFLGLLDNNNITTEVAENSWGVSSNQKYPRLTNQINLNNLQASSLWLKNIGTHPKSFANEYRLNFSDWINFDMR